MKPDDLLQPILNTAAVAIKQGVIIGRREAFREAAAIARSFDKTLKQLEIGELIAREIEKYSGGRNERD